MIIGLGIVSALGLGVEENLKKLQSESDALRSPTYFRTTHNVPVGEVPYSNDELQRLAGYEGRTISRTSLLGMLAAEEALTDAGIEDRQRVVFISATTVGGMDLTPLFYKDYISDSTKGRLRYVAQHDCASSTKMIKEYCRMGGHYTAISTACSSAANAIMLGERMIAQGLADVVVAGGTDALCAYTLNGFKSLMILDSEKCRPMDSSRSGLNLGEAAAYVVLARSGKKSYCRVSGYGNANDAHHQTAMTTDGQGPQAAMRGALITARLSPEEISYINVHGTATANNDLSEYNAMRAIWGNRIPPFSSTKGFTGHTLAAAGSVEAVFAALALREQKMWANLRFVTPIDEECCPIVHTTDAEINHVMSNSFGFGGNCTSLIFSKP
jgi:3-oxoacyl-[acyl-carrier-protein] synthase-1